AKAVNDETKMSTIATAKAKAKALNYEAKMLAFGYVSSPSPPFDGSVDKFITEMMTSNDLLSSASKANTDSIKDALQDIDKKMTELGRIRDIFNLVLKKRQSAENALKKKNEKTDSKKMEKYEGKMTLWVTTPSGQRIKVNLKRSKSLAFLKDTIGEKSKEFGKSQANWRNIVLVKAGKFINKHARGMAVTHLCDNDEIEVMWYEDLPDDAFPEEEGEIQENDQQQDESSDTSDDDADTQ
ncbi:unnamed protein product, partial [Effrenium voratum]